MILITFLIILSGGTLNKRAIELSKKFQTIFLKEQPWFSEDTNVNTSNYEKKPSGINFEGLHIQTSFSHLNLRTNLRLQPDYFQILPHHPVHRL